MELSAMFLLSAVVILLVILFKLMDYFSRPRFLEKAVRQYKDLAFHKLTQKNISSFQEESTATYISAMSNDIASIEQNLLENQFCSGSQWDSVFRICFYDAFLQSSADRCLRPSLFPSLSGLHGRRRPYENGGNTGITAK